MSLFSRVEADLVQKSLKDGGEMIGRCRKLDVYGNPVRLTFKGSDTYKTNIGATVSVFAGLVVVTFGLFNWVNADYREAVVQQIMHQDTFYNKFADIIGSTGADVEEIRPNKRFAFGLGESHVDESVGRFRALQITEFD